MEDKKLEVFRSEVLKKIIKETKYIQDRCIVDADEIFNFVNDWVW